MHRTNIQRYDECSMEYAEYKTSMDSIEGRNGFWKGTAKKGSRSRGILHNDFQGHISAPSRRTNCGDKNTFRKSGVQIISPDTFRMNATSTNLCLAGSLDRIQKWFFEAACLP
jgi:hypothetical protein